MIASRDGCKKTVLAVLAVLAIAVSTSSAHYLWVSVDGKSAAKGTVNVYFEDGAAPGNGEYLEPVIKNGKTWIRTLANPKPTLIPMKDTRQGKLRWLTAPLTEGAPRSIDSYGKFGVYRYGKTDVLLHYYARFLQVDSHEELHELSRAKHLNLDIVPHDHADEMELTVLWRGKPATDRIVHVRGPKGLAANPKTDKKGRVRFTITDAGKYVFRTNVEESATGNDGGKDYVLIRHHATMLMTLPLSK